MGSFLIEEAVESIHNRSIRAENHLSGTAALHNDAAVLVQSFIRGK